MIINLSTSLFQSHEPINIKWLHKLFSVLLLFYQYAVLQFRQSEWNNKTKQRSENSIISLQLMESQNNSSVLQY